MGSRLAAYDPQMEIFEGDQPSDGLGRHRLHREIEEIDLAIDLMELRDEQSLHRFVGRVVDRAAHASGAGPGPAAAAAIQRLLVATLRQAIQPRPRASGTASIGTATLGDRLMNIPDHRLGLELEGLSDEDREFETGRQIVRFASEAARGALAPSFADPVTAARTAALAAARRYAPGLVASLLPPTPATRATWPGRSAGPGPP